MAVSLYHKRRAWGSNWMRMGYVRLCSTRGVHGLDRIYIAPLVTFRYLSFISVTE